MFSVRFRLRYLPIATVPSVQCLEIDTATTIVVVQSLRQCPCEHAYDEYSLSLERSIRSNWLTEVCYNRDSWLIF